MTSFLSRAPGSKSARGHKPGDKGVTGLCSVDAEVQQCILVQPDCAILPLTLV